MKKFNFTILLIITLFVSSCHSDAQKMSDEEKALLEQINAIDLKDADKLTTLMKVHVKNHADIFNTALINFDFETLYDYMPEEELKGQSRKEFIESSQEYQKLMSKSVSDRKIVTQSPSKVVHCESGFFSLLHQTTSEKVSSNVSSWKSQLLGISSDGIHWKFYNMGESNGKQIKKLHPEVCNELLNL